MVSFIEESWGGFVLGPFLLSMSLREMRNFRATMASKRDACHHKPARLRTNEHGVK